MNESEIVRAREREREREIDCAREQDSEIGCVHLSVSESEWRECERNLERVRAS